MNNILCLNAFLHFLNNEEYLCLKIKSIVELKFKNKKYLIKNKPQIHNKRIIIGLTYTYPINISKIYVYYMKWKKAIYYYKIYIAILLNIF